MLVLAAKAGTDRSSPQASDASFNEGRMYTLGNVCVCVDVRDRPILTENSFRWIAAYLRIAAPPCRAPGPIMRS